jgi:hypothetical protein
MHRSQLGFTAVAKIPAAIVDEPVYAGICMPFYFKPPAPGMT